MNTLYIIDPLNFKGQIVNTMTSAQGTPMFVDYMDEPTTIEEYRIKKNNPRLIAIDWEEFEKKYYRPYLNSLCKEFQPETEEQYWDALECLPPKRWTTSEDEKEFFFVGECTTADLYSCHVKVGESYYTALRPIGSKADDLFNMLPIEEMSF